MAEKSKLATYDTQKILEQMKEEYWRGLSEAEADTQEAQLQLVTFWLGDEFYAVDAPLCKSIIKVPNIVRVPQVPEHVLGVVNLRGRITSVVDLRRLFQLKLNPLSELARLIVVEAGEVSTALVTERVVEITNRPEAGLQAPMTGSTQVRAEFVKGYYEEEAEVEGQAKKVLLIYLDLEKVLNSRELTVDYRAR